MARAGAKQRVEENKRRLQTLTLIIACPAAVCVVMRLLVFRSATTTAQGVAFIVSLLASCACYNALAALAKPYYDASGELMDGGVDFKKKGMVEYYKDWIYLAALMHAVSAFTAYGWYLFFLVPVYVVWMIWTKLAAPYFAAQRSMQASNTDVDAATRKRLEKKQRKEQRQTARMGR